MIVNRVVKGGSKEKFIFAYSGNFTDNRNENGSGTVRLTTSGTLTVLSGTAIVSAYILGGGGGAAHLPGSAYSIAASGGSGGNQTIEVELSAGESYKIVVGVGGEGKKGTKGGNGVTGVAGGDTSAFGYTSTGGKGGNTTNSASSMSGGSGGTPNGEKGEAVKGGAATGGIPNGGAVVSSSPQDGGDGYVELTFS